MCLSLAGNSRSWELEMLRKKLTSKATLMPWSDINLIMSFWTICYINFKLRLHMLYIHWLVTIICIRLHELHCWSIFGLENLTKSDLLLDLISTRLSLVMFSSLNISGLELDNNSKSRGKARVLFLVNTKLQTHV